MKTLDTTGGRGPYPGDDKMREEQAAKHRKSMEKYYAQQAADREELTQLRAEIERLKRDVEHYAQAILWEGDMIVTQTRYQQVHAHIAELEAECERLRLECAGIKTAFYQRAEVRNLQSRLEASEAECEELRADVVWVARVGICQFVNGENVLFTMTTPTIFMRHDGTPAAIQLAVREARNGVS